MTAARNIVVMWTDPKTGLQVRVQALEFADSPVVEWTAYFKNEGKVDAPILEYVQALDVSFPVTGEGIPTILYSKGCGVMDTYALQKKPLNQLESFQISSDERRQDGRDDSVLRHSDGRARVDRRAGMAGQWAINFSRPTEAAIAVRAGMGDDCIFRCILARRFELRRFCCCPGRATTSTLTTFCAVTS